MWFLYCKLFIISATIGIDAVSAVVVAVAAVFDVAVVIIVSFADVRLVWLVGLVTGVAVCAHSVPMLGYLDKVLA